MTEEELKGLKNKAKELNLCGWNLLEDRETCLKECNGMGADWMPENFRYFLTSILKVFAPATAIHDMRYFHNQGDRNTWDDEFYFNCRHLARDKYGKYNPMRYICYGVARRLRIALTVGGTIAWKNAGKRSKKEGEYDNV